MTQRRNRRSGVEDRWADLRKTRQDRNDDGSPMFDDAGDPVMTTRPVNYGVGKRWRARYVDDAGKEYAKGFTRKVDAQKWLDEKVAAMVGGTYVDPKLGAVTFNSFYRVWSKDQVWEKSSRANIDSTVRHVTFGDMPLGDLEVSHVQAWIKAQVDQGLKPVTIRTRFGHLRTVLRAARKHMPRDVTTGVTLPRAPRKADQIRIPTPAQVGYVLTTVQPDFRAFVAVCAFAGLRLGEAAALKVSDVAFLEREIHVRRQVQAVGGTEVRAPKYGSTRTVPAPAQLIEILAQHVRLFCPGKDPDRWLWRGRSGDWPMSPNRADYLWSKTRDAAGVDCRLHDLRHFYASGLIAAGCDVVTVQKAMGHSSASITLDTYSHLWPDASDKTRSASAAMWEAAADALRTEAGKTAVDLGL